MAAKTYTSITKLETGKSVTLESTTSKSLRQDPYTIGNRVYFASGSKIYFVNIPTAAWSTQGGSCVIEYQILSSLKELSTVRALDERIWGMQPTPIDQTLTVAKNGGLIIGAFVSGRIVGFSYGFPGYQAGQVYLCSHKLGVLAEFRDRNIGYHLKVQQAQKAKAMGYRSIRWTYDPLEARNAYLNISKLGGVCREYIENCYGDMSGTFNADLPSDRFNVEWNLSDSVTVSRPTREHVTSEKPRDSMLLNWRGRETGLPEPVFEQQAMTLEKLTSVMGGTDGGVEVRYVPIPRDFQVVKHTDIELAMEWRMATREVFQHAFANGWMVTGIASYPSVSVQLYVLSRDTYPAGQDRYSAGTSIRTDS